LRNNICVFSFVSACSFVLMMPGIVRAQAPDPVEPRKQWVTFTLDWAYSHPLHFKERPLEELTGVELGERQAEPEFGSGDGRTTVDIFELNRRIHGWSVAGYPLGAGNGPSLMVRYSYETLPVTRFEIRSPAGSELYLLTDGTAKDFSVGVIVSDRQRGWGLGAHSFFLAGFGKLNGERGSGDRYLAEAGAGINVGPLGFQFAVKIAYNKLSDPRAHSFYTVPISLRGTVSF
jgi:hypothetical protein